MEPISTSILALSGAVIKGLELIQKRREGKLTEDDARNLYSRVFVSLLWEVRQNLSRCYDLQKKFKEEKRISAGILSFFVREALFSEYCIMCPESRTISKFNEIYSAFERIHHWQRTITDMTSPNIQFIAGFAADMFEDKKLHEKYNQLVLVLREVAPKEHVSDTFDLPA